MCASLLIAYAVVSKMLVQDMHKCFLICLDVVMLPQRL